MELAYMNTPIGNIEIKGNNFGISSIQFVEEAVSSSESVPDSLQNVMTQLREYFSNNRASFDIKLNPEGTDFQNKVWQELQQIPFGKTTSYQKMANRLGDPKVIRAAASANGKNPIAVVIPCHRVIGTDGSLTGYAGGLHRKKWLLEHESGIKQGQLF
ncbi:MAG: methylated-DNA--[protein]-cysteine S-methyltransferase [Flavobacteriaceae bacterium]|nr:methylated-DNA--[protein]-cysteine S-methyltransferase [Flavobacteriaceae bacterium]